MPLGLGLGLGLQKPTPPPVSAWPTIADIPQGAVVLDTDGVVKRKIGDYLVESDLNIVGYTSEVGVTSLNPSLYTGYVGPDILYPVVTSLPTIVTNGVRYVVGGVEYLGNLGSCVAQPSVTLGLWYSVGNSWVPAGGIPSDLCVIPVVASGDGGGVSILRLTSSVNSVVSIDGLGKFYTNAAGTVGESTSVVISAGVLATIYVRLASGSSKITVTDCSKITSFGDTLLSCWQDSSNSPFVSMFNTYYTQKSQNVYFSGTNISIAGITYPWVNVTQNVYFLGNSISIAGMTYPWANVTRSIFFSGTNISIAGITYPWVNVTQNILFSGNNISIINSTSLVFGSKYNRWYLRPKSAVFTSEMTDRLLIDLASTWTTPTPSNPIVDLRGNCGPRTTASDAAVLTLQGRGITVSTN